MAATQLTRTHRILLGLVVAGTVVIAAIGFAGSYTAVRELAERKGFGDFSLVFPLGIDAGICVLLALDLLLTWLHIPFPLLRQTAWLLTAATVAFNGAAAWPDPLGVGMHAVIPVLFVVAVEAARHAVGRIADITADKHMEGVRLARWLLSPFPTFRLWRRMKLWELRSYEQVVKLEQERLIYQARLRSRYGRGWRRRAPVEALMPLRLARYGVPLAETAPAGLAAAGVDPVLLPSAPKPEATGAHAQPPEPTTETVPEIETEEPDVHVDPEPTPASARREEPASTVESDDQPSPRPEPFPGIEAHKLPASPPLPPEVSSESPSGHGELASRELTTADRYYLGWDAFVVRHGREPHADELADFLGDRPGSAPAGSGVLHRHLRDFQLYRVWARLYEEGGEEPAPAAVVREASRSGVGRRHGTPVTVAAVHQHLAEFRRRHRLLGTADAQPTAR
ncbi:DUF2637 domain-containing protein [Streptomyces sp. NPDC059009]|uniref:DUF2637 domain-containing protein n=1 Tax=Streptomyces sp. NPDC059009 TaxID=3346694 RepID=UPI00369A23E9